MTAETSKHAFQAEVQELLDLMIHSLYSHREIFLRELISNASDALDRYRVAALTREEWSADADDLCIRLEIDPALRVLRVTDNGIGMTREDMSENLGTIAHSGTRQFLEKLRDSEAGEAGAPDLIGQFGVGFYSSFMVADEVAVESRHADAETGFCWRSSGGGEYTLEEQDNDERGTSVTLHLRGAGESGDESDEDAGEFLEFTRILELTRKYSDFVEYPILVEEAAWEAPEDLERREGPEGKKYVVLNSMKPLWARARDEVTAEEHAKFFRHLTHEWSDPIETIHFKAEGASEYTALLYVPEERSPEWLNPSHQKSRISLYVRRVFVMAECEDLMPQWMRFVRGVVDSQDLPLNVSRELLQKNRAVEKIRERLVKKVLDALEGMLRERREDYERFWKAFGTNVKEGIVVDAERFERIAGLALFGTTHDESSSTLGEYVERMKSDQDSIFVLLAPDRATAESSPYLEALRARGFEVLFLTDPIDEWVLQRLREFDGKPVKNLSEGEVDLGSEAEKGDREERERESRALLEKLEENLGDEVSAVRFTSRLTESVAVLVSEEGAMGPNMERMMRENHGDAVPKRKRILELNPGHELVRRMQEIHESDPNADRLKDFGDLIYGQALLTEGSGLPDPVRFARLVTDLMVASE